MLPKFIKYERVHSTAGHSYFTEQSERSDWYALAGFQPKREIDTTGKYTLLTTVDPERRNVICDELLGMGFIYGLYMKKKYVISYPQRKEV